MKWCITIFLIAVAQLSFSQTQQGVRNRLQLLGRPLDFQYDSTGFSSLPRINYQCDNKNRKPSDYYHVLDFNADGLKDLVYSGPCGKTVQTAIFLNTGKAYKRVYENSGRIISIEQSEGQTAINIFKEACCCEFFSQYTEVVIDAKSQVSRHTIVFGAKTKISVASRFKEDKVMGTIRTTPHVNDVIQRDGCNNTIKGNQLTRIHDFKDVIQLNKVGPWWLVLYPETRDRSWIGWMKLEQEE